MVAATAFVLASGNRRALVCDGRSLLYEFIGGGIAENTGVFLVLLALGLGDVSVAVPLAGTAPLFVLLMTFLGRRRETPSWRVIVGAVLIVLGVFLLKADGTPPPSSVDEQPVPLSS
jgi:drug/metabolite transporter (DMT)-like permease